MRILPLFAVLAMLLAPAGAAAQKRYHCMVDMPAAVGKLSVTTEWINGGPPQRREIRWTAGPESGIELRGRWVADPGRPLGEGQVSASFNVAPGDRRSGPRFELYAVGSGKLLHGTRSTTPAYDGIILFPVVWSWLRDQIRAVGPVELIVTLHDSRVLARRRIGPGVLDAVEAQLPGALAALEPLLADPLTRCA